MKEADTAKLQEIRDYGWEILSDPRKHRSGGGIALLYNKDLKLTPNSKVAKYKSFQVMEAVLETTSGLVRLINIYRPPYTKKAKHTEATFLCEFEQYLCNLSEKPGYPIMAGDFNIHVQRPEDLYPGKFLNLLLQHDSVNCGSSPGDINLSSKNKMTIESNAIVITVTTIFNIILPARRASMRT